MKKLILFFVLALSAGLVFGQNFEEPKQDTYEFNGVKVKVGGDFALQFQALNHSTKATNLGTYGGSYQINQQDGTIEYINPKENKLYDLVDNFNLPTANLDINASLAKGVKMHLRTYLSARHHNEAWVKGGYLQIDDLSFIKEGFLEGLMKYTTFRFGQDEINYGDTHFRRSDNAEVTSNPFVGNYIMDSFTTEIFGDVTVQTPSGFLGVLGISNGKLNQQVIVTSRYNSDNKLTLFGKLGFDKQINDDLRLRLTGSFYHNDGLTTGTYLYGGDRAGSRYYYVLTTNKDLYDTSTGSADNATSAPSSARFNPGLKKMTAFQIDPFIKYQGLEFFGVYEIVNGGKYSGTTETAKGKYTQLGAEVIYRFGNDENLYFGGRYNSVKGKIDTATDDSKVNRFNIGGGWFMTKNILTKIEYVKQTYSDDGWSGALQGGEFNGVMLEAAISF